MCRHYSLVRPIDCEKCQAAPEDEVRVDALVKCEDCETETDKLWDNGDGKDRCETCAVRKYGRGVATMLWPKNKPYGNCST